jgi:hypothetical protein
MATRVTHPAYGIFYLTENGSVILSVSSKLVSKTRQALPRYQERHSLPVFGSRFTHRAGEVGLADVQPFGNRIYIHDFPDKVSNTKDGWAVRFMGCVEGARWQDEGAARVHLDLLQREQRKPQPEVRGCEACEEKHPLNADGLCASCRKLAAQVTG